MKARGFTIEQHDAAGRQLFRMNRDLFQIRNVLFATYPEKKHKALFKAVYKFNDALFALRNKLDDYVCRETQAISYLYFLRNDDGTAPGLDSSLECCSPEVLERHMAGISPADYRPIQATLKTAGNNLACLGLALDVAYRDPKLFRLVLTAYFTCMGLRRANLTTVLKTPRKSSKPSGSCFP